MTKTAQINSKFNKIKDYLVKKYDSVTLLDKYILKQLLEIFSKCPLNFNQGPAIEI